MSERLEVKIKKIATDATIPEYQTSGAAGFDLHAYIGEGEGDTGYNEDTLVIHTDQRRLIRTGLSFAIPEGYELQLRPRSGLAYKHGITLTNSPATIDSDYRGEVKVLIHNTGLAPFFIRQNDRIAQGVIAPVKQASFVEVEELDDTERGVGGFGSSGV